jgi:hypothetical protein
LVSRLRFLAHLCTLLFSELQVRCVSIRVLNVVLLGYVSGSKVFLLVPPTKANLKNGHPLTGRQALFFLARQHQVFLVLNSFLH